MANRDHSATEMVKVPMTALAAPGSGAIFPWVLLVMALTAAATGFYFGHGLLEQERGRTAAALKQADEVSAKAQGGEAARVALEERITKLEQEKAELEAKVDALEEEIKNKNALLSQAKVPLPRNPPAKPSKPPAKKR